MSQTFKTEEDYVRYSLKNFRPNRNEEACSTHPKGEECPSIGAWVHDEGTFQEYTYTCEDCEQEVERFVKNEDGSLTDNLYIHKDVEDKSLTDCCKACYIKRKKADQAFWSED